MSNSCKDIIESFRIFNARIYNNILFLMQPSSFWGIWIELITKNIYKTRLKVKERNIMHFFAGTTERIQIFKAKRNFLFKTHLVR